MPSRVHASSFHRLRVRAFTLPLILLIALVLRLINLTAQPLWFDEGWSVWFATTDLSTMIARTAEDIHPPFYYALLHGWVALCGVSEVSLRLLSVVIGVLAVAAIYLLARRMFDGRVAVLSALLFAI